MVDAAARIWRLRNEEIIASNDGRIVQSCGTCREAGTTGGGAGGGVGGELVSLWQGCRTRLKTIRVRVRTFGR